jgi:outer membrane protease
MTIRQGNDLFRSNEREKEREWVNANAIDNGYQMDICFQNSLFSNQENKMTNW